MKRHEGTKERTTQPRGHEGRGGREVVGAREALECGLIPIDGGPEHVLCALREQADLFDRLESFARKQRGLIRGEDNTPLLALLADRQRVSARLSEIATQLEPTRRAWSAVRERLAPAQRAEAEQLLSKSQECLRRVISSDEEDARLLSARKQMVAEQLRTTHSNGRAMSAYGGARASVLSHSRFDEAL